MSTLDVVAEILREVAPRALKAREIAEMAIGRLPTQSKTPETVVSRDLALDVLKKGFSSRFLRVGRGEFVLKHALSTAFYNDNDEYAASWSRNLIEAGEIPRGVVDERSIRELQPADVASYRHCHFFSGLGTWARALRDAGWPDEWPTWSGSCPCQGMSQAGRRLGFADPRHLWPDWFRLIDAVRPPFVFGEQVASKDGLAWLDLVLSDLGRAGYAVGTIDSCAAGYGAPHLRQRLYFVAVSREGGRQILREARLHDPGKSWHDLARCGEAHDGDAIALPDAAVARPQGAQDAGADRTDAVDGAEAREWGTAGDLELERDRHDDGAGAVSDAERLVRDEGRTPLAHGRSEVELDGHGEADGAGCGCVQFAESHAPERNAGELGDSCLDGAGEHARELSGDEAQHEEWAAQGDHASVAPGPANGTSVPCYRPGDRVQIVDDPTWGGSVRGFWADDVEWVWCRPAPGREDGCFRPARAGLVILADGFSPELAGTRAKRLRSIGNAIVLPQAIEFVGCAIGALFDWSEVEDVDAKEEVA